MEWGRYQFWNGVGTNIVMGWLPVLEWGGCQYWNGVGTNVGMGWVPISGWGGERDKTKKGNKQKRSYRRIKLSRAK